MWGRSSFAAENSAILQSLKKREANNTLERQELEGRNRLLVQWASGRDSHPSEIVYASVHNPDSLAEWHLLLYVLLQGTAAIHLRLIVANGCLVLLIATIRGQSSSSLRWSAWPWPGTTMTPGSSSERGQWRGLGKTSGR